MILAHNNSDKPITITHKMKIAQGVIAPYFHANWNIVEKLDDTVRGVGGYGHTG